MRERYEIVHEHAVEGLFIKGLAGKVTPALKTRLRAVGLDLDQKLKPTYPKQSWREFLTITVEELFPGMPRDKAAWRLGELLSQGYVQTWLGKTAISVAKMLGPRRTLQRFTDNIRTLNTSTETRLTEVGPTEYDLWVSDHYGLPYYVAGGLSIILANVGCQGVEIKLQQVEGDGATYRISWVSAH